MSTAEPSKDAAAAPADRADGLAARLDDAERLRLALDAGAVIGSWFWDVQRDHFVADARFADTFGVDAQLCHEGLPLSVLMESILDEDRPRVADAIAEVLARGGPYRCEYRVRDAAGAVRWIEASGRVDKDASGAAATFPGVLVDIDDRRRARDELARVHRLLESFLRAVPGVVYAKDREGRLILANTGTAELIGKPPEVFLGRTDREILDNPDEAETVMRNDARIMASGRPEELEEQVTWPDGRKAWWLSTKAPLTDETGEVIGLVGASIDITDRLEAEQNLRLSEARFRSLADAMPQLVWTAYGDGRVDYYNAKRTLYAGISRTDGASYDWSPLVHPDDLERTREAWAKAVATGEIYVCEHRLEMAEGGFRWHVSRANPDREADGQVTRWYGTATDIHAIKMAEQDLRESEARLRLALTAGRLGDWAWDAEQDEVWLSPRAREIYGLEEERISPAEIRRRLKLTEAESVRNRMGEALQADSFEAEYQITRPDQGRRWISARAQRRPDGSASLVGVIQDITDVKRADERRTLMVNELNHRVKNTLAVVQGLASQTFRGLSAAQDARRAFEERLAALSRAHNVLTGQNWESADLRQLVRDELSAHQSDGRIEIDGPAHQLPPGQVVNVALAIHELATNAVKYGALSTPEGRVRVSWRSGPEGLSLDWIERGGPPVSEPQHRGFGSRLLEQALAADLGGKVERRFAPEGLECRIEVPRAE